MMKAILPHLENMLTQYWKYAPGNNKNVSLHLLTIKDNGVTAEYKLCILRRLRARTSPQMWGEKKYSCNWYHLNSGRHVHCCGLPKGSEVTTEKTIYKLQSIFLLKNGFISILCSRSPVEIHSYSNVQNVPRAKSFQDSKDSRTLLVVQLYCPSWLLPFLSLELEE